jgi:hypothetical protein
MRVSKSPSPIPSVSPGRDVAELVARVKAAIAPLPVRVHFHNTRNTGLANVWPAGNVPTEDVIYLSKAGNFPGAAVRR